MTAITSFKFEEQIQNTNFCCLLHPKVVLWPCLYLTLHSTEKHSWDNFGFLKQLHKLLYGSNFVSFSLPIFSVIIRGFMIVSFMSYLGKRNELKRCFMKTPCKSSSAGAFLVLSKNHVIKYQSINF